MYKEGGAGNGTRTRDIDLGKVALYQLSYSRVLAQGKNCPPRCQANGLCRFAIPLDNVRM